MKNKIVLISAAFVLVTAALMFTGCGDPGGGGGTNAATPTITTQPQDQEYVYLRDSTVLPLTVAATVSDGGTLKYQWYYKTTLNGAGNKISGEVYEEYEPYDQIWLDEPPENEEEGDTYYFYVEVTNTNSKATGKKTATKISDYAVVTYVVKNDWDAVTPQITGQPQGATYTAGSAGTVAALTVTASKSSTSGMLSYQWYSTPTGNIGDGIGITTGGTSASYTPDIDLLDEESMGFYYYYVVVTNTDNTAPGANKTAWVTSDVATITVTAGQNWSAATPQINDNPSFGEKTQTFAGDTPLTLTVTVTRAPEPTVGTLSYQWYKASSASADGEEVGTDSSTYALSADDLADFGEVWFYVVVTNTNNAAPGEDKVKTATSTRARITIIDAELPIITNPTLGGNKSINIGVDDEDAPVLDGTATVPNGDTPTYAWYSNATNSNTGGTLISTATGPTFKPDLTTESGLFYYVIVTNGTKTATSSAARYAVNDPATPYIISGSGSTFSATRGGVAVGTTGSITDVISAIKSHAAGNDCTVQFGDLSNDATGTINIGNGTYAAFTNASDSTTTPWGTVTIMGKITGSRAGNEGTVLISADGNAIIKAILKADIENTNNGATTSLAANGKALSVGVTAGSSVEVQSGTLKTTGGGGNAVFVNAGTVTISGGTCTSVNIQANTSSGTVNQTTSGAVIIRGTALVENTASNANARTVYSNSSGATTIWGGTITAGTLSRVISIASADGSLHLAGNPVVTGGTTNANGQYNVYFSSAIDIVIDPAPAPTPNFGSQVFRLTGTLKAAGQVIVQGGGPYLANFDATPVVSAGLTVSGNNLVR